MTVSEPRNRGMVVSIPKAGTYLAVRLLEAMGVRMSHLHVRYDDQGSGVYDFCRGRSDSGAFQPE